MSDGSSNKVKAGRQLGPIGAFVGSFLAFLTPDVALLFIAPFLSSLNLSGNLTNFLLALIYEALLIGVVTTIIKFYKVSLTALGLGRFELSMLPQSLIAFVFYLILSMVIASVAGQLFSFDQDQSQEIGFEAPKQSLESVLIFIALVILAPLAEELLFRGFLFFGLRRRLPFWATSVVVSLLFAFVHGQVNVGVDVFALSLVLCYLREKTQSLWPAILLHAFKNGLAYILLFVYKF